MRKKSVSSLKASRKKTSNSASNIKIRGGKEVAEDLNSVKKRAIVENPIKRQIKLNQWLWL